MSENLAFFSTDEIRNFYVQISTNVRKLRESKGMSQLEMALSMDISSVAFYSNCESCRYDKHFNLEHIYKISKILGVEVGEIFKFEV
ncbi:helix-turn-helix transcriptional regulator [uncultured Campylobacter sp.]|uniref:helix-turn-helix transcriptional regulator n=1 Tax=uncultured Campylobacter sp. TaxID=218934 RepID=UPI002629E958|nr:helix-turn-helix transcriptional regulator [uncultured Campylobacter sp.]